MGLLEQLYQTTILEHYKHPRGRGRLERATHHQEGVNPGCGDELELFLKVIDGELAEVAFVGEGCAISQASASLMTEAVRGKTVAEALQLAEQLRAMLRGAPPDAALGELRALQGVSKLPVRVKCAALPWVTRERALGKWPAADA